jgi:pterin-4a-carbinolamine dehydratase
MSESSDSAESSDRSVLDADRVRSWAAEHHPWSVGTGSDRLLRTFLFDSFGDAMSTHDAGGVTALDLELGEAMNAAAHSLGAD